MDTLTGKVAFITGGLEKRSRHVYVPGWVGASAKGRSIVTSSMGDRGTPHSTLSR
jgi:hypothetical protein